MLRCDVVRAGAHALYDNILAPGIRAAGQNVIRVDRVQACDRRARFDLALQQLAIGDGAEQRRKVLDKQLQRVEGKLELE